MKNRLKFVILILGVIGIFFLSYFIPEERFKWEDNNQVKNISEIDEKDVSFKKVDELSLYDKFNIIYNINGEYNVPVIMKLSDDEKDELTQKAKSVLEEFMTLGIIVRDDNYFIENVEKKLYMDVTDSVNIVILYSVLFFDTEGNELAMDIDGDSGTVMGFMEERQDEDTDIEKKAEKYVDYLGGSYMSLDKYYYDDVELYNLGFHIDGKPINYTIRQGPYRPIYYIFGVDRYDIVDIY